MKKRFTLPGLNVTDVVIDEKEESERIILLLHGYAESGNVIHKRLAPVLSQFKATVIAPNGPFPLPQKKEDHYDINYAWYFYDNFKNEYFIDFTIASVMLRNLVNELNPKKLPVTVIGYSQGGYLAPFAAKAIEETQNVLGINCVFREDMILEEKLNFYLDAIHGKDDLLVDPIRSKNLYQKILPKTKGGEHLFVEDQGHRLEGGLLGHIGPILSKRFAS